MFRIPALGHEPVQRAQSEMPRLFQGKGLCSLQVSGNAQRIPAHVHGLVYIGRGPLQTSRVHLLLGRVQQLPHPLWRHPQPLSDFLYGCPHIEDVLCRVVMHLANFIDVVIKAGNFGFFFIEHCFGFVHGPCEVVAVVIHGIVGVLRSIESAALPVT